MNISGLIECSEFPVFYERYISHNFNEGIVTQERLDINMKFVNDVNNRFAESDQQIRPVIVPRCLGKTLFIKMHAIWNCLYNDNITNAVVSFRDRMPECYKASALKLLLAFETDHGITIIKSITSKGIVFKNGSQLLFMSYESSLTDLKGRTINNYYWDEFAIIPDKKTFWTRARVSLVRGGNIWIVTSAGYKKQNNKTDLFYIIFLFGNPLKISALDENGNIWGSRERFKLNDKHWDMEFGNKFADP